MEESSLYTLTGALREDKPLGPMETGESQVVAAMVLLAATVGSLAIKENKVFTKAIIFGQLRAVVAQWEGAVHVYKLEMKQTRVSKGKTPVDTSNFIQSVKHFLEHPEQLVC